MKDKKKHAKRYRLHWRIRKQGYRLNTKEHTIYIKIDMKLSKQVWRLKSEFDYLLQIEFKDENE